MSESIVRTFRIPAELDDAIETARAHRGVSRTDFILDALRLAVRSTKQAKVLGADPPAEVRR